MPDTPYARLRVSLDGGPSATGGVAAKHGQTVSLSLENLAGVSSARWEIYGHPPSWPAPPGWKTSRGVHFVVTDGAPPPDFPLPPLGTWGKWLLAVSLNGDAKSLRDATTGIEIRSPHDLRATPPGEEMQFGGWAVAMEHNWRIIDDQLGPTRVTVPPVITFPPIEGHPPLVAPPDVAPPVTAPQVAPPPVAPPPIVAPPPPLVAPPDVAPPVVAPVVVPPVITAPPIARIKPQT